MDLPNSLVKQLSKAIAPTPTKSSETTVYGKMATNNSVQFDGATLATPVETTVAAEVGDRVTVLIKNHTATVTGNLTEPAAKDSEVKENKKDADKTKEDLSNVKKTVDENGNSIKSANNNITALSNDITAIGNTVNLDHSEITSLWSKVNAIGSTVDLDHAEIENLWSTVNTYGSNIESDHAEIETLWSTVNTYGSNIESDHAEIETLWSTVNTYGSQITNNHTEINNQWSTIENLGTSISTLDSSIEVYNSSFKIEEGVVTGIKGVDTDWITTQSLEAVQAKIESLDTTYANIDFANIGTAAIEKFIATSGLIKDAVVGDQTVTGELVGVTISGDLIKANTIKADSLIVKGTNGLYYALNVNALGETTASSDIKYQNGIDGSNIIAQSVTADKIKVTDLTAFNATIGGFNIGTNSIYSGAKESVSNTTRGIYMDTDGQFALGDDSNYLKFYKTSSGAYTLELSNYARTEKAIYKTEVQYALSDSETTAPTSGWNVVAPAWVSGKYMWQRTVITYGDGTVSTSDATCINGAKGDKGETGAQGDTGTGISSIVSQYYLSTSSSSCTGGSWSTAQPTWSSGKYIWTRSLVTWSDNTTSTTTAVLAKGLNQANEAASDAAKTATNYMSYSSSDGLVIGNKTSGSWSGNRAQITSSSFNILNSSGTQLASFGSTVRIGQSAAKNIYIDSSSVDIMYNGAVLASFSPSNILLGQNSAYSSIGFCQGKGYIDYSSSAFRVCSNSVLQLKSTGTNIALTATDIELTADDLGQILCYSKLSATNGFYVNTLLPGTSSYNANSYYELTCIKQVSNPAQWSNLPTTASAYYGILFVLNSGDSYVAQLYLANAKAWYRIYTGSSWLAWLALN